MRDEIVTVIALAIVMLGFLILLDLLGPKYGTAHEQRTRLENRQ